jgi:Na+-transporting NADH:ubiquinone oxidoreductase subunit NqrF
VYNGKNKIMEELIEVSWGWEPKDISNNQIITFLKTRRIASNSQEFIELRDCSFLWRY